MRRSTFKVGLFSGLVVLLVAGWVFGDAKLKAVGAQEVDESAVVEETAVVENVYTLENYAGEVEQPTELIEELKEEVQRLREENVRLQEEIAALKEQPSSLATSPSLPAPVAAPAMSLPVQWETPNPVNTTIAQVLANPVYDQVVTVSGTITHHIEENEYILSDGTNQLIIEGGPPWYHRLKLPVGQEATVTGEVDFERWSGRVEIDIFSIILEDGKKIAIRDGYGPPPWAGGPHRHWKLDPKGGPPPWEREW